jgi:hypothetical protein
MKKSKQGVRDADTKESFPVEFQRDLCIGNNNKIRRIFLLSCHSSKNYFFTIGNWKEIEIIE